MKSEYKVAKDYTSQVLVIGNEDDAHTDYLSQEDDMYIVDMTEHQGTTKSLTESMAKDIERRLMGIVDTKDQTSAKYTRDRIMEQLEEWSADVNKAMAHHGQTAKNGSYWRPHEPLQGYEGFAWSIEDMEVFTQIYRTVIAPLLRELAMVQKTLDTSMMITDDQTPFIRRIKTDLATLQATMNTMADEQTLELQKRDRTIEAFRLARGKFEELEKKLKAAERKNVELQDKIDSLYESM